MIIGTALFSKHGSGPTNSFLTIIYQTRVHALFSSMDQCGQSQHAYRISTYSFRGNYSFLKVENVEIFIQFPHYGNFLLHKLNSCCGNYSRGETIQGRKLFAEVRYMRKNALHNLVNPTFYQGNLQQLCMFLVVQLMQMLSNADFSQSQFLCTSCN